MRTRTAVAGLLALTMASAGCATRTAGIPTAADEPHVTQVATTTEPKPQAKPEGHGGLRPDVIVGSTKKQQGLRIALTFDDGPDPTWTPQVLDLLAKYDVKATFCLIGVNAKAYPALVKRI